MFSSANWAEETQTYLTANSGLGYVNSVSCFIGRIFLIDDVTAVPSLTMYEEDGSVVFGRIDKQTRTVRFVLRDTTAHGSLDRAHALLEWVMRHRVWKTATYNTQLARVWKTPGLTPPAPEGVFASDVVVQFLVTSK